MLDLCRDAARGLDDGPARRGVTAVGERLAEPTLRIAVGGRVNAGKSTLVNALAGQRLAPTDNTECTKMVVHFTYHHQSQVVVGLRDGGTRILPGAPGGGLPAHLNIPAPEVADLRVLVSNAVLRDRHSIVDTPGLDSLTGLDAMSAAALTDADAVLYVMPHPGANDEEALAAFHSSAARPAPGSVLDGGIITAANTIGVLSRVDQLGDGQTDPWLDAPDVARRYEERFRGLLAAVVPVCGLLAQAALGQDLTETDAAQLRHIAGHDPLIRAQMLYSAEDFLDHDDPTQSREVRARLHEMLGIYGIRQSVDEFVNGRSVGAVALARRLRRDSGIDALLKMVEDRLLNGADRLRSGRALVQLEAITWQTAGETANNAAFLKAIRVSLARLSTHPTLRQFRLVDTLRQFADGTLAFSEPEGTELVRLATGGPTWQRLGLAGPRDRTALRGLLQGRIAHWREREVHGSPAVSRHARTVRENYESLYLELLDGLPEDRPSPDPYRARPTSERTPPPSSDGQSRPQPPER